MKKLSKVLLALVLWVAVTVSMYAQNQMNLVPVKQNNKANQFIDAEPSPVRKPLNVMNSFSNSNKTSVISFKTLGAAGNSYTAIGSNRHRVAANNATNSIVHIHRTTAAMGGTGKFRIDVSSNAGSTFTNNVLVYDNLASGSVGNGRYPQVVIHNPSGNTNPANAFAAGVGALTGGSGWNGYGMYAGKFDGTMQSEMASANSYLIAQTLHEANGIYWAIDFKTDGSDNTEDTLIVLKGTWNTTMNRIDWTINNKLKMGATMDATPEAMVQDVCIAFGPSGMTGYIMVRGDLASTHPSNTCAPVLWKTTDGGNTWSLINYDMGSMNIPNVTANLPVDSNRGVPINFFYAADIAVDNTGRFHIIGAVAGAAGDGVTPDSTFYLYPNASRYLVHVWGSSATTVSSRMIDSLQEYSFPVGTSTTVNDNCRAQISRTEDGTKVFFVWADDHDAIGKPDIWMQGFNPGTGMYTPIQAVTNGTTRDNDAEQLSITPTVLGNTGCYEVPMVIGKPATDDLSETTYTYIDDAQVCDAQFTISSVGNNVANTTEPATFQAYPNPATESVNFTYTLNNKANVELSVFALDGRLVSTITKGNQGAGTYTYTFNRAELPAGVYMARFVVDGKVNHNKIVLH
jgi:hypothetical protein